MTETPGRYNLPTPENIEPQGDDVVTIIVDGDDKTLKVRELPKTVTAMITEGDTATSVVEDVLETLLKEGLYCEYLNSGSGGGWKKGKIRLRFEFVPNDE
jgi:hypothetical protein